MLNYSMFCSHFTLLMKNFKKKWKLVFNRSTDVSVFPCSFHILRGSRRVKCEANVEMGVLDSHEQKYLHHPGLLVKGKTSNLPAMNV